MKNKKSIAILMAAITLASCQSYKKVPYLQSYKSLTDKSYKEIVINEVNQQDTLYDAHIQPKDLLNITINTTDPQAAAPFNLTMQTYNNIAQSNASTTSQPALQQYFQRNENAYLLHQHFRFLLCLLKYSKLYALFSLHLTLQIKM